MTSRRQKLHLIATGGTLEKSYQEPTGRVENAETKIGRYLRRLRLPYLDVEITSVMNIDSLFMTNDDRATILQAVVKRVGPGEPVLITHGTDTMVETGRYLRERLAQLPAPIVLTGAMAPLGFEDSDGLQNLTESLLAARLLSPGIYIVMHNQVFPIDAVRKDRERARFVFTDEPSESPRESSPLPLSDRQPS
ncbi:MAG TPA: asparaginase domain-containing protein [Bryobacteraceae bacterium]|nr:asparaginase domain-containing protein [Bryobacteraceae bacterium]